MHVYFLLYKFKGIPYFDLVIHPNKRLRRHLKTGWGESLRFNAINARHMIYYSSRKEVRKYSLKRVKCYFDMNVGVENEFYKKKD